VRKNEMLLLGSKGAGKAWLVVENGQEEEEEESRGSCLMIYKP